MNQDKVIGKTTKKSTGRPTKITEMTVYKLEQAFLMGCNTSEACIYAGISRSAFYNYIEKIPEFKYKIEQLQNNLTIKAKMNIAKVINDGCVKTSMWRLSKTDPE